MHHKSIVIKMNFSKFQHNVGYSKFNAEKTLQKKYGLKMNSKQVILKKTFMCINKLSEAAIILLS